MTLLISKVPLCGSKQFLSASQSKTYAILSDVSSIKQRFVSNVFPTGISQSFSAKTEQKHNMPLINNFNRKLSIVSIRSQHSTGISLPELLNDMLKPMQVGI